MAVHAKKQIDRRARVMGRKVELLEYFREQHKQVNDSRDDDDQPELVEHASVDFIGGRIVDNGKNKSYKSRSRGKS